MLFFLLVPVMAFIAGFLTHWRLARKQRHLLNVYRHAFTDATFAPGRRR